MSTRTLLLAIGATVVGSIAVRLTYAHLTGNTGSFITTATGFTLGLLIAASIASRRAKRF